jgi:nucleotide-binding universal stress UspA family protein
MKSKRVLIPIDLMRDSADALVFAQQMAQEEPLSITLLHVVDLNIQPALRVHSQLCSESEAALRKLAKLFFGVEQAAETVIRAGNPADEIVAEAKASRADLIVLCGEKSTKWPRLFHKATIKSILPRVSCPTVVLPHSGYDASTSPGRSQRLSSETFAVAGIEQRSAAA